MNISPFTSPTSTDRCTPFEMTATASSMSKRNFEVFGEVIQRSQWNDAERNIRTGNGAGDGMDGAVSPAGDNCVDLAGGGPFDSTLRGCLKSWTWYKFKAGRDRMLAKGGLKFGTQIIALFPSGGAGGRVQQHADAPGFRGWPRRGQAGTSNRGHALNVPKMEQDRPRY